MDPYEGYYNSPLGTIKITYSTKGISSLIFSDEPLPSSEKDLFLQSCFSQLDDYFNGELKTFELDTDLQGTEFQVSVWKYLLTIPYGRTKSYLDIARYLKNSKTTRAVGNANGSNPVSIIVPCHRVIGRDGSLTGYAGGIWRKKWLLDHELRSNQLSLF